MLYNRFSLFIHFKYSNVYMTFLKSLTIASIQMNLVSEKETSVRKKLTDLENELMVVGEKGSVSLVSK